jgi:hypothetical protein
MKSSVFIALVIAFGAGCGSSEEQFLYTLDLTNYSPRQTPPTLRISNSTLVLPLALGMKTQPLSEEAPGDLINAYTRVGCWIDDPALFLGLAHSVRAVSPVHLTQITVDQTSEGERSALPPDQLAMQTCFTYRSRDGAWHGLLPPSKITASPHAATAEIALDVTDVDAAAIFLPTYTYVSKITYRADAD